jgi:hypothetical protein
MPRTFAALVPASVGLALLAASACDRSATRAPSPGPSASSFPPLPTGLAAPNVLLRAGAWLHTHPPPAGERARNPSFPLGQRQPEGLASRYRLVRDLGAWVLVEAAEDDQPWGSRHCRPRGFFGEVAMRLYVAREDLVPVLTRPLVAAFDDGTRAELRPGTPLSDALPESDPTGRPRRVAFSDVAEIPVGVPDDAVGLVYDEPPPRHVPPAARRALSPDAELTFDGRALKQGARWGGYDPSGAHWVYAETAVDGGVLVDLEGTCGRFRARVDGGAVRAAEEPHDVDLPAWAAWAGDPPLRTIRKGAAVTWRDGSPAGVARVDTKLEDEGVADGARRCFDELLGPSSARGAPESTLRFCAAEADVVPSPSHRSDEDVARIGPKTTHYVRIEVTSHPPLVDPEVVAAARAVAKDELLTEHGDVVAIAPPGETAAQAKKKVPARVRRLLVRLDVTMKDGTSERRCEVVDEGLTPPDVTSDVRTITTGVRDTPLRALFHNAFASVLVDPQAVLRSLSGKAK